MAEEKKITIIEKAAYLKGLADGLALDKNTTEGKLIGALIDLVGDLANAQNETDDDLQYLNDYIEEIDEDLGALEKDVYDIDDDDCCCCDDDDCDCCDDDEEYEVTCPSCGEKIVFDGSISDDDLVCPNCKEKILCDCDDKKDNK